MCWQGSTLLDSSSWNEKQILILIIFRCKKVSKLKLQIAIFTCSKQMEHSRRSARSISIPHLAFLRIWKLVNMKITNLATEWDQGSDMRNEDCFRIAVKYLGQRCLNLNCYSTKNLQVRNTTGKWQQGKSYGCNFLELVSFWSDSFRSSNKHSLLCELETKTAELKIQFTGIHKSLDFWGNWAYLCWFEGDEG